MDGLRGIRRYGTEMVCARSGTGYLSTYVGRYISYLSQKELTLTTKSPQRVHKESTKQGYPTWKREGAMCAKTIVIILEGKIPISCLCFMQLRATYNASNICPQFQLYTFRVKLSRYLRMNHSLASKTSLYIICLVIHLEQCVGLCRMAKVQLAGRSGQWLPGPFTKYA